MKSVSLNAYPRNLTRRSAVKKLRQAQRVPAVIYGRHTQPQNLEVNRRELEDLVHHSAGENLLLDLSVSGDDKKPKRLALLQDVQHHPLNGSILHVDLHEVAENETVTVTVPVETVGEAVGVKTGGGVLEHVLFKIKLKALPKDLPEVVYVDVSNLEVGQSIHISDIPLPAGVEVLADKKVTVLSVAAPLVETAEEPAAGPASGQVEMIKEKKEEGAAPADKGGEKKAEKKK